MSADMIPLISKALLETVYMVAVSMMISTIIGIPLGILGSFAIYKAFANGSDYGFIFPWQAILIAIFVPSAKSPTQ